MKAIREQAYTFLVLGWVYFSFYLIFWDTTLGGIQQLNFWTFSSTEFCSVIAFAFMMTQTALMETAADEMTKELKEDWFKALLRQDMAYYDIRDVSSQASIISTNGRQYKK